MFGARLQAHHRPLCSTEVRNASVGTTAVQATGSASYGVPGH